MKIELFTIGHSNHSLADLIALLQRHEIRVLVDIRRFPGSRKFPHFNSDSLAQNLPQHGIEYQWIEALGGRRPKQSFAHSPNGGLRNVSFRNYADYMLTESFRQGVERLCDLATSKRTAIMCSESVFWRCHRRLVSDYIQAAGGTVHHIFPAGDVRDHALTKGAKTSQAGVIYPETAPLFDGFD